MSQEQKTTTRHFYIHITELESAIMTGPNTASWILQELLAAKGMKFAPGVSPKQPLGVVTTWEQRESKVLVYRQTITERTGGTNSET